VARKSAADLQKAKEAKQKKLLIGLVPLFLLLAVWQGPKMYKEFFAAPPPDPRAVQAETTPAAPAPEEGAPAPAPAGDVLLDSDPLPAVGSDRLVSFSRFTGRDPFLTPYGYQPSAGETPDPSAAPVPGQAVIELNGVEETVPVGGSFPASGPVFSLVSVSESGVTVGLVSGTFEGGGETVEIAVGEQVDLVADPDGTRYTVRVVSVG
jgi:hypothetical protein